MGVPPMIVGTNKWAPMLQRKPRWRRKLRRTSIALLFLALVASSILWARSHTVHDKHSFLPSAGELHAYVTPGRQAIWMFDSLGGRFQIQYCAIADTSQRIAPQSLNLNVSSQLESHSTMFLLEPNGTPVSLLNIYLPAIPVTDYFGWERPPAHGWWLYNGGAWRLNACWAVDKPYVGGGTSPLVPLTTCYLVMAPYWSVLLFLIVLFCIPLWGEFVYRRGQRRLRLNKCINCSYDLRAHSPGSNCPECGTPVQNSRVNVDAAG
jgi:hypothetical protein